MTGAEFQAIRKKEKLSAVQFARILGYDGADTTMAAITYRFEAEVRPIPAAVARLVYMIGVHGVPKKFHPKVTHYEQPQI